MCVYEILNFVTYIIISFLLGATFFWVYLDRHLTNHKYLFWYGMWFLFGGLENIVFYFLYRDGNVFNFPLGITFFTLTGIEAYFLYKAGRNIVEGRALKRVAGIILAGVILQGIGLFTENLYLVSIGALPKVVVYWYVGITISKAFSGILRIPLLISILVLSGAMFKFAFAAQVSLLYFILNLSKVIFALSLLGIHTQKIQKERDEYKIQNKALNEALLKVDLLEDSLLRLAGYLRRD